jgi:hypothetical protein
MGYSTYDYGDIIVKQNGTIHDGWFTDVGSRGELYSVGTITFPDGTKLHGYSYDFDREKDSETIKASRVERPDGSVAENPSEDEIMALFQKDGNGDLIRIHALDDMAPQETAKLAACSAEVQAVIAKALAEIAPSRIAPRVTRPTATQTPSMTITRATPAVTTARTCAPTCRRRQSYCSRVSCQFMTPCRPC